MLPFTLYKIVFFRTLDRLITRAQLAGQVTVGGLPCPFSKIPSTLPYIFKIRATLVFLVKYDKKKCVRKHKPVLWEFSYSSTPHIYFQILIFFQSHFLFPLIISAGKFLYSSTSVSPLVTEKAVTYNIIVYIIIFFAEDNQVYSEVY